MSSRSGALSLRVMVPALIVVGVLSRPVLATTTTCVSSAAGIQAALTAAASNFDINVIQVVQGTYSQPSPFAVSSPFPIQLLGGYVSGCASRVLNPTNTILDGLSSHQVLNLAATGTLGNLVLEGFTVQNGSSSTVGGGAVVGAAGGNVTVRYNIFRLNAATSGPGVGGLYGFAGGASTYTLANNLFANNNDAVGTAGAALLSAGDNSNVGTVYVVGNTVTGNTVAAVVGAVGGIKVGVVATQANVSLANNILWGNAQFNLSIVQETSYTLLDNDIQTNSIVSTPGSGVGNLIVDPLFMSATDFHLQITSPVINVGTSTPPGVPLFTDLDGNPRQTGPAPDMGAYESSVTPVELQRFTIE